LRGKLDGWRFELFNYSYVIQRGKSSKILYLSVVEIELPRVMPHIILDSQLESGGSALPIQFDKDQRIKLEGDFDNYIHLYAPQNYQIAALSIITPDVMQTLLGFKKYCDIEIIGARLYFYWLGKVETPSDYKDMLAIVESMLAEISTKLTRGDIFANEAQAQVHSSPIASGARLKKSTFGLAAVLFTAGYLLVETRIFGEVISALIGLAILAPIAWKAWRKRKARQGLLERASRD